MRKCFGTNGFVVFLSIFIFFSDQISKFIVVNSLRLGESVRLLPFFNIVRVENKGITFGFFSGTLEPLIIALFSLIVTVYLGLWAKKNKPYRIPACIIMSGAIGNLFDRFTRKAVIDFLDFHLLNYHWPAFNIADSAIVIGAMVLFYISYGEEKI
ncbi:MAG: signal peptidase II [Holosporaceae bacterium]|jgi:signal peptidase II|nr:signal peptidase II [Holosporaceae bacterium]